MDALDTGLIFVNLVDFDQQYGHRNDIEGYGAALEQLDAWLPRFHAALRAKTPPSSPPTRLRPHHTGTDHTREYVPLLIFVPRSAP